MASHTVTLMSRLKDLGLALLNATLLLSALCLGLAYGAVARFDGALDSFGERLALFQPVREELHELTLAVTDLRDDLRIRRQDRGEKSRTLSEELDAVLGQVMALDVRIEQLSQRPQQLIDASIEKAAASFGAALSQATSCSASSSQSDG